MTLANWLRTPTTRSANRHSIHSTRASRGRGRHGRFASSHRRHFLETLESRVALTAGALDPTFGDGGKVLTDFASPDDGGSAIALQADGKIVVAGASYQDATGYDFAVARYNADGSLDPSFGVDGRVTIDTGPGFEYAYGVAVRSDGKIIVVGLNETGLDTGDYDLAVVRLNGDGTPDNTFDGDGKQTIDFGGSDRGHAVAVQGDKTVVVGFSFLASTGNDFAVARLNDDGTLDTTFNGDGRKIIDFGSETEVAAAVAVQADKILVVGDGVARLNYDGTLDTSFNGSGLRADVVGEGVVLMGDKIVLVGSHFFLDATNWDFKVTRLNDDGTLDNSFDGDGQQIIDFGSTDIGLGVAAEGDKIVVAGYTSQAAGFAVARLIDDGTLDNTFDGDGKQTIDFDSETDVGVSVAVQADGNIVVAGYSFQGATGYDFAVVRLLGDIPVRTVTVDIQSESLNVGSNGSMTVVIYGTADFYASQIDAGSVRFAGAAAWGFTLTDVNNDGHLDLQLNFHRQDTTLDEIYAQLLEDDYDADGVLDSTREMAEVAVTGQTQDDELFSGADDINLFLSGRALRELLDQLFE